MRTIVLKKDGKSIDMFKTMDIIRDIKTYIAKTPEMIKESTTM